MNQVSAGERFFVYGSMTQGLVHFKKIEEYVLSAKPAKIQATAYFLKVGFPVVVQQSSDWVEGELVTLSSAEMLLPLLDQFHGFLSEKLEKSLYFRQKTTVLVGDEATEAWVYFLNPKNLPKTAQRIEGGQWREAMIDRKSVLDELTDSQKTYIQRLGKVSGRQIVPIDLQLYRELMNLELIVDKGRRLALSKFGHEVFRYLE